MVPVGIIRKNYILRKLKASGAVSEGTARTLEAAGLLNARAYVRLADWLAQRGTLGKTRNGRYFLKK